MDQLIKKLKVMKLAREIKIQKLQTKNKMAGQTFNPGGHTSESLDNRERLEIKRIKSLSEKGFLKLGDKYKAIEKYKHENNLHYSNSFVHNIFLRNFGWKYNELKS